MQICRLCLPVHVLVGGYFLATVNTNAVHFSGGVFTSEDCLDRGLGQQKVFMSQTATIVIVWDLGIAPSLSQGEFLSQHTLA